MTVAVYVETGAKRVFAGALEWPGWCRSGRDVAAALETLTAYRPRYAAAVGRSPGLPGGAHVELEVVEKLKGDSGTDFGVPSIAPGFDARPVSDADLKRLIRIQRACWAVFDAAAEAARGVSLRKGPRGGGRDLDKIRAHVHEAELAYLAQIGRRLGEDEDEDLRDVVVHTLAERVHGVAPQPSARRKMPFWTPRYFVRRSAWHALDHAWEIEDRAS